MPSLGDLPVELQVAVVDGLDAPKDILSLALTHRHLRDICIPYPLHHRLITDPPLRIQYERYGIEFVSSRGYTVWQRISEDEGLLRDAHIIRIKLPRGDEMDGMLAPIYFYHGEKTLRLVVSTAKKMSRIRILRIRAFDMWTLDIQESLGNLVDAAACSSFQLREVEVRGVLIDYLVQPIRALSGLVLLKIVTCPPPTHFPYDSNYDSKSMGDGLHEMIRACPYLEVLHVVIRDQHNRLGLRADDIFKDETLSRLRDLRLAPVLWDRPAAFFERHPTLEQLHLNVDTVECEGFLGDCTLHHGALPALRALSLPPGGESFVDAIAAAETPVEELFLCGACPIDTHLILDSLVCMKATLRVLSLRLGMSPEDDLVVHTVTAVASALPDLEIHGGVPLPPWSDYMAPMA